MINKLYQKSLFNKIISLIVYTLVIVYLSYRVFIFFNLKLNFMNFTLIVFFSILIIFSFITLYGALFERLIIQGDKLILYSNFRKKELFISNIKGYTSDRDNISIYSKDESIILVIDKSLKNNGISCLEYFDKNFKEIDIE